MHRTDLDTTWHEYAALLIDLKIDHTATKLAGFKAALLQGQAKTAKDELVAEIERLTDRNTSAIHKLCNAEIGAIYWPVKHDEKIGIHNPHEFIHNGDNNWCAYYMVLLYCGRNTGPRQLPGLCKVSRGFAQKLATFAAGDDVDVDLMDSRLFQLVGHIHIARFENDDASAGTASLKRWIAQELTLVGDMSNGLMRVADIKAFDTSCFMEGVNTAGMPTHAATAISARMAAISV